MDVELLKALYLKKYGREFPFDISNVEESSTPAPMRTEDFYSVCKFRYENKFVTRGYEHIHKSLLEDLEKYAGETLMLHLFHSSGHSYLFCTDEAVSELVGVLTPPEKL